MFRGSYDILAMVDLAYALIKSDTATDIESGIIENYVNFTIVKNRFGIPFTGFSFLITKNDKIQKSSMHFLGYEKIMTLEDKIKEEIINALSDNKKKRRDEIENYVRESIAEDFDTRTFTKCLTHLIKIGKIKRVKRGVYLIEKPIRAYV